MRQRRLRQAKRVQQTQRKRRPFRKSGGRRRGRERGTPGSPVAVGIGIATRGKRPRSLLWSCVFIVSTFSSLAYVSRRVHGYMWQPVTTDVATVRLDRIRYPSLLACADTLDRFHQLARRLHANSNATTTLFTMSKYSIEDTPSAQCWRCHVSRKRTTWDYCKFLEIGSTGYRGLRRKNGKNSKDKLEKSLVVLTWIQGQVLQTDVLRNVLYVPANHVAKFAFNSSTRLNMSHHPCESDEVVALCYNRCVKREVKLQVVCKLLNDRHSPVYECADLPESYRRASSALSHLSPTRCECTGPCNRTTYSFVWETHATKNGDGVLLKLHPANNVSEVLDQSPVYTLGAFVSDVSGVLAILLGVFLLAALDVFDFCLDYVIAKWTIGDFKTERRQWQR